MAIDVNKVYTTCLSILNKKGSGYMTPDNFNKIAPVAQIELLDRAFHEYNQAVAKQTAGRGAQGVGDIPRKIMEKLEPFATVNTLNVDPNGWFNLPGYPVINVYKTLSITTSDNLTDIEHIEQSKIPFLFSSPLTAPSETFPMYYYQADRLYVFPTTIQTVNIYYIGRPADPVWNSSVDTTSFGTPVYTYNANTSSNFRLHASEEPDLILTILKHFGVTIKDPLVIQSAMQEEQSTTQLEQ